MDPREFRLPRALRTADYRLTLSVSIADVDVLWSTAAARLLKSPGITVDDIDETIGSREDPSISDCLAALWEPLVPAGCVAEDMYLQAETASRPANTSPRSRRQSPTGSSSTRSTTCRD